MFKPDNFIYFLTVCGFFIGLIFSVMKDLEVFQFLFATMLVTAIFHIIGLAGSGLFVKSLSARQLFYLDKVDLEKTLDLQIDEIEKRERDILEAHYFINQIEEEELKLYSKDEKK